MTKLGTDLALHLPTELGTDVAAPSGPPPPVLEVPETIPGLMAWLDSRTTAQMNANPATGISSWASRAGSLGTSLAWVQATSANRPVWVVSEPLFGGRPAVLFDGVNDWLEANDPNAGTRLHNGLGGSVFRVLRVDSTGGATQRAINSCATASQIGLLHQLSATILTLQVCNGSGTSVSTWNLANVAHYGRDVSRWQMWGYVTGMMHSRVSGSSLTNADTGGPPSTGPAAFPLRIGASNTGTLPFKGWLCTEIYYDHVLTAGETSQLAAWAAAEYPGVAA